MAISGCIYVYVQVFEHVSLQYVIPKLDYPQSYDDDQQRDQLVKWCDFINVQVLIS